MIKQYYHLQMYRQFAKILCYVCCWCHCVIVCYSLCQLFHENAYDAV